MSPAHTASHAKHSLSEFTSHSGELTDQIKRTGRPLVLTVRGKAEFVVQDTASYEALIEAVECAETVKGIRRGLEQAARGEGRDAEKYFAEFRAKHGIRPETGAEQNA